ncbi:hypothetical protein [Streptomyces sp. NE06-03C]|uniref:hypothetical protein n=1 Tax=Streptomyces sp. NE06-03C TaxID=3028694 RepID=UPI0029A7F1B6|nr:hypothetical protein [Streptomyces sp. NE06-03C]MDX2917311.1 hypothetical protein [Streptomyces sp. NE06-03C]
MPKPHRRELVAAAARYSRRTEKTSAQNPARGRQERAWSFYRTPEVRSFANWIANAMSGAHLYAGRLGPGDSIIKAPDNHPAARIVSEIAGGRDGQAQLLREYGRHLAVAGEGWTVIRPRENAAPTWHVVSVLEMATKGKGLEAQIDGAPVTIPVADEDTVVGPGNLDPVAIRVWDPSPEKHLEADSPVLGSLDELEELRLLGAAVRAITLSRLTGRGLLIVPKGTRFPSTPVQGGEEDDLIDVFMQVAETAIRDPASAAATVPIILEVPAEMVGNIQKLTFESNFDELAIKLREENIRRFATAADIPGEFLLGMGSINHWGAWELTSEAIRLGIEPRLSVVTHAYTENWLHPLLENEHVTDAEEWCVFGDTAPLRVRTNRSETALKLFELKAISGKALRRETGFDEADAPDADELNDREQDQEQDEDQEETPVEDLPVDEAPGEPDTLPAAATPRPIPEAVLAAADALIWAALSAAGRKMKNSPACPRSNRARVQAVDLDHIHTQVPVTNEQVDQWRLLDGAWSRVPEIAVRYGIDPECMTASLDSYVRDLIAARIAHEYGIVPRLLGDCSPATA